VGVLLCPRLKNARFPFPTIMFRSLDK